MRTNVFIFTRAHLLCCSFWGKNTSCKYLFKLKKNWRVLPAFEILCGKSKLCPRSRLDVMSLPVDWVLCAMNLRCAQVFRRDSTRLMVTRLQYATCGTYKVKSRPISMLDNIYEKLAQNNVMVIFSY